MSAVTAHLRFSTDGILANAHITIACGADVLAAFTFTAALTRLWTVGDQVLADANFTRAGEWTTSPTGWLCRLTPLVALPVPSQA